uniref:Uncharacterized protein n=1 Tax=Arundo donax TaxID=35708 RepID=A0A0A8Y8A6_ARUDO
MPSLYANSTSSPFTLQSLGLADEYATICPAPFTATAAVTSPVAASFLVSKPCTAPPVLSMLASPMGANLTARSGETTRTGATTRSS